MTDREKVLQALEHCDLCSDMPNCPGCAYLREPDCVEHLKRDALALLKAQEPTECENTNKARIFCCSVCGYEVADIFIDEGRFEYPSINFCPNCGRKVKWE